MQAALTMEMEETFRGPRRRPTVSMSDVTVVLGAAYINGQISDPLRFLFRRLPDVRDVRCVLKSWSKHAEASVGSSAIKPSQKMKFANSLASANRHPQTL